MISFLRVSDSHIWLSAIDHDQCSFHGKIHVCLYAVSIRLISKKQLSQVPFKMCVCYIGIVNSVCVFKIYILEIK